MINHRRKMKYNQFNPSFYDATISFPSFADFHLVY